MAHNLKRFLTLLFAAVVMVSLLATTAFAAEVSDIVFDENPVCYTHGDANNDGKITRDDAFYILYSYLWGEEYPITHKATADVDGNNSINTKDALYTLYAVVLKDENHPLNDNVHEYYTPFWSWGYEEVPADPENPEGEQVSVLKAYLNIKCSCGTTIGTQTVTPVQNEGGKAATCLTAGSYTYDATAEYTYTVMVDGKESTVTVQYSTAEMGATYVEELAPTGHQIGMPNCVNEAVCSNPGCDVDPETEGNQPYTLPALGHKWKLSKTTPATCQAAATEVYTCTYEEKTVSNGSNGGNNSGKKNTCTETLTKTVGEKIDHTFAYVEGGDKLKDGTTCEYVKTYKCTTPGCNETTEGGEYSTHVYTAVMTKEATCSADGLKTYTCTNKDCTHSYTETVPVVADAHKWSDGTTTDGITTYVCAHNSEHKKTAVAAQNVSKETLKNVSELDLGNNATIKLDEATTNALPGADVSVSMSAASEEAKATLQNKLGEDFQQIQGNIYNFSMTSGESSVTEFGGNVTISLPYTLQPDDDVDAIDIWFIDDDGKVAIVQGKYANGFVTFTTNHFSYYTVTRLTPAQRCAAYGHDIQISSKAATCTEDGYHKEICKRCGLVAKDETYKMLGHAYGEAVYSVATTCTEDGQYTKTCTNAGCDHSVEGVTPALNHILVRVEDESSYATCDTNGVNVTRCTRAGCDHVILEETNPLGHKWAEKSAVVHYVTCTSAGYTEYTCSLCNETQKFDHQDPLGHAYVSEGWTWSEDHNSATLKIVCKNDHDHDQIIKGIIQVESTTATCTVSGAATYTATAYFNNNEYTESKLVNTGKAEHTPDGGWTITDKEHSRYCSVCESVYDAGLHAWDHGTITTAATCNSTGTIVYTCTFCGHTRTETIPATGLHSMTDGVCGSCGYSENTCDHTKFTAKTLDLTSLGVCPSAQIKIQVCECGKYGSIFAYDCGNMAEEVETEKTLADGSVIDVTKLTCADCSMFVEAGMFQRIRTDICAKEETEYYCVTVGDRTILELTLIVDTVSHPTQTVSEYDLHEKGLCEETILVTEACPCGEVTEQYLNRLRGCGFSKVEEQSSCPECGAVLTVKESYNKVGCENHIATNSTITLNGQEIVSVDYSYVMKEHTYGVPQVEMEGDDCEDGITVHHACENCSYSYVNYYGYHAPVYNTTTDLYSYGTCDKVLIYQECACGKESYSNTNGLEHAWEHKESGDMYEIEVCTNCNVTRTTTIEVGEKNEKCRAPMVAHFTYETTAGQTYEYSQNWGMQDHHALQWQITLKGASCLDGLIAHAVCKDCGFSTVMEEFADHVTMGFEEYDMNGKIPCGGVIQTGACVCGQQTYFDWSRLNCNWTWVHDNLLGYGYDACTKCGTRRIRQSEQLYRIDSCHNWVRETDLITTAEGEEILNKVFETIYDDHRMIATCTLNDPAAGCEGGYTFKQSCQDCNTAWEGESQGHEHMPLRREITRNQLCSDLDIVTMGCPCGQLQEETHYEWSGEECRWEHTRDSFSEDPQTGKVTNNWVFTCAECGATKTEYHNITPTGPNTCDAVMESGVTFRTKTGKLAGSLSNTYEEKWHRDTTASFEMLNPEAGCEGGYHVINTCTDCSYAQKDENIYTECNNWPLESIVILKNDKICGDIELCRIGTPCGKEQDVHISSKCQWDNWYWDEQLQCSVCTCSRCGLMERMYDQEVKNLGTCTAQRTFGREYILNGKKLAFNENYPTNTSFTVPNHAYAYTLTLKDQATSCEDGFTVSSTCQDCRIFGGSWEEKGEHYVYPTKITNLRNHGMCGGEVGTYRCACGKEQFLGWSNMICEFEWVHDPVEQRGYQYCSVCHVRMYDDQVGYIDPATCTFYGDQTQTYKRYDEETQKMVVLFSITNSITEKRHDMYTANAVLLPDSDSCEDGVEIINKCKNCDYTDSYTNNYHHGIDILTIDLSNGCGGQLRVGSCACGQQGYFDRSYNCANMNQTHQGQEVNGVHHNYNTYTCPDPNCALVIKTDNYAVEDSSNCRIVHYEDITIEYKGQTYTAKNHWNEENHDREYTSGTLVTPGTTCEQGVNVNWKCTRCKATGVHEDYRDHALLKVSSIDLSTYGAICEGSALNFYQCVCGAKQGYDFDDATKCDLDFQLIKHFIPGVIDTKFPDREEGQHTTAGWMVTDSVSYLIKCGVNNDMTSGTSQTCPLTIRMSEYWLNENCDAVEYQVWQLGYNEETGTCETEFKIPTGERHGYHEYEEVSNEVTNNDGSRDQTWGYVCKDCGSEDMNYNHYDATGKQTQHIWSRINKSNTYEPKSVTATENYAFVKTFGNQTYNYASSTIWDYVQADGSTSWERTDYSNYVFGQTCTRDYSRTFSDPNRQSEQGNESACLVQRFEFVNPDATCTQPGTRNVEHRCVACNRIESVEKERIEPAHTWEWNDQKQMYVCTRCDLENKHNASGNIILEDMTEGTERYTIGYYVKDNQEFSLYFYVLFNGTEVELNSQDSFDIQYHTDPCSLSVNKAAVLAAAAEAMGTYIGTYEIRVSFYPYNSGEGELDYSITFDALTKEA